MARLFLVLICLVVVVLVTNALISATKSVATSAHAALGENMPKSFQNIAYVVLILLMFGVVTGWLGGL